MSPAGRREGGRRGEQTPAAVGAAPGRLGRFELRRLLGRGAQASVWLAHDPRLQREVAVKVLSPTVEPTSVSQWLEEARVVSRLTHPNIVPLFEADEQDGQPYLVFEFVEGGTLAESLRRKPVLGPREAVELLLGILDALAAAHEQGIVHRDLKPSNVLIGPDGRPRVMDFGIAARMSDGADGRIVGTPGYISPEAARGQAPVPQMDVFAAGVMLAEMLTGKPLLRERDVERALAHVQQVDLVLPADAAIDDALRSITQRAISRDLALRHESAAALGLALRTWLLPGSAELPAPAAGHGTIDFLLRRMRHKADFPALGDSILRIQRAASSDSESLATLSSEILRDVALTNKLLRMVNSAQFGHAGGGSVTTVSRAVALVGFAGVRNLALSLVLLEHMQDRSHASLMREEFLRALMAATLAGELAASGRESEETFIAAMFQSLGRLLTEYYFPEEAQQIRMQSRDASAAAREAAAQRVLGIGFDELGVGIARSWGLPDALQKGMRAPEGDVPSKPVERGVERTRWLGRGAHAITDVMLLSDAARRPGDLEAVARSYAAALGVAAKDILTAAGAATAQLADFVRTMGIHLGADSPARRLLALARPVVAGAAAGADDAATVVMAARSAGPPVQTERLTAGIQAVTEHLSADQFKLNEVLRITLEAIRAALGARRVVFCLRDAKTDALTGRFGVGEGADSLPKVFHVPLDGLGAQGIDLFGAVCRKGADTVIADAGAGNIAQRLPAWYRQQINAPWFLLLPLLMRNAPFGLIYADAAQPHAVTLTEGDLSLLRTLRNQAVMAFRQAERR